MAYTNYGQLNFASGELSPKVSSRKDLKIYANGCRRMQNFFAEVQGPARFRPGEIFVHPTRRNNVGVLIPFQFSDAQAYELEFTDGYMRVYKDGGIVLETAKNITGATKANPGVVTSAGHSYANGDEVCISGIVGMTELNGKFYLIANSLVNTFTLQDLDGNAIDTTGYTTYVSGGTVARVFELVTPYAEAKLLQLKYSQNADTMYIMHSDYEIRKLTRTDHDAWTISKFTRTNDPFTQVITAATQANPCVITIVGHGYSTGDQIHIEDVAGMTNLNGNDYTITVIGADTFSLNGIDSTGYGVYTSGGYVFLIGDMPHSGGFYEGRFGYGGTKLRPESFWLSRGPEDNGAPRYDDFTAGVDADHALAFTLGPVQGKVDSFRWLTGNTKYLLAGTFGGITKVTGGRDDEPITPLSITVKPVDDYGCADINPISKGGVILYVQRGQLIIRSFEYDVMADNFISIDRNLPAEHMTESGITQIAFQTGRPDLLWATRDDGILVGLTFKSREDVSGWHRHYLGGSHISGGKTYNYGKVLSVGVLPQANNDDQVWTIVEREINGVTRRYVGYFSNPIEFQPKEDFFTEEDNELVDYSRYLNLTYEKQKEYIHVDSAITYDGTVRGTAASATITPGALTGDTVTFTASASVFIADDVGNEIWRKYVNGTEAGRAKITAYVSATEVTCEVLVDFTSTDAIPVGEWYITASSLSGLEHLEGETVVVVTDGRPHPDRTVTNGAIALQFEASVIHVGLKYVGILQTQNLEFGGINGPAQAKLRNISGVSLGLLNTLGLKYGTSLYKLQTLINWDNKNITSRPNPIFTGIKALKYSDNWENEKYMYIVQDLPLPASIQLINVEGETTNE